MPADGSLAAWKHPCACDGRSMCSTCARTTGSSRSAAGRLRRRRGVAAGRRVGPAGRRDPALRHTTPASVDVALAVDVNVFWTSDAAPELAVLRRLLVPGGRLAVCFGADGPRADAIGSRVLEPVAQHVTAAGFVDVEVRAEPDGVGVLARSPSRGRG